MKPILFNTEMVRAFLEGRKTVTRRVVKDISNRSTGIVSPERCASAEIAENRYGPCANFYSKNRFYMGAAKMPYRPGDILYVRETWGLYHQEPLFYVYKADALGEEFDGFKWRPSIHMPKEAARIFLRVTGVRVEWLQDISGDACAAEGTPLYAGPVGGREEYYRTAFATLWSSTIKPKDRPRYGWEANPWVWVIEFERISREAALAASKEGGKDHA